MNTRTLTLREKIILIVFIVMLIGPGIYYGLLRGFLEKYQSVSDDLDLMRQTLSKQQALLSRGQKIDHAFDEIKDSLPKIETGRGPEMVFTEDIANLCKKLEISLPAIDPHKVEKIPDVPGYAYLILPLSRILGEQKTITRVLNGFYERKLIVRTLKIETAGSRRGKRLTMSGDVAQILRIEDLSPTDQKLLKQEKK